MFPEQVDLALALAIYAVLIASVAYGRPPNPRRARGRAEPAPGGPRIDVGELLWLGALAVAGLYPAAILVLPGPLRAAPFAYGFPGDELLQTVGFLAVVLGGVLVAGAFRALGRFATVRIEVSSDHTVVREGPYARIRHPMYTANILWTAGIALTFLSTFLWVPVLVIVLLARSRAGREERIFLGTEHLRGAYAAYIASTGRFLPRPRPGPSPRRRADRFRAERIRIRERGDKTPDPVPGPVR